MKQISECNDETSKETWGEQEEKKIVTLPPLD